jgi:hypothetical protein
MKTYAIRKSDDSVYTIQCKSSPEQFLLDPDNDEIMCEITDTNPLPSKGLRDAWKDAGGGIAVDVDLPAARTLILDKHRAERDTKLIESDAKWVEKMSKSEDTTALETYKQELRDLPATMQTELDALDDETDIENYEPTWPTEPA